MSRDHIGCPRCGVGGATSSPRWHWLHRIRQRPHTPLAWFGNRRGSSRNQEEPQRPPSLPSPPYRTPKPEIDSLHHPSLPTPRPRALTLDSSPYPPNPAETSTILHTASQSSCLFFSRLPLELRILVYGHLFGNRTLHILLRYDYPDRRGTKHGMSSFRTDTDMSRPVGWYWWHSVCHRDPEIRPYWWWDMCRDGGGIYCDPRGKDKGGCELDTRWLTTCRQGYSEAIAVLYRTNRFHFQSDSIDTIKSFPLTFLPQRLATITAVDIYWPQNTTPRFMFLYTHLWDGISLMANVRSLRINLVILGLLTNPLPPDSSKQTKRAVESEWLGPVDELVGRLGSQLKEFSFLVSSSLYSALQRLGNEEQVLWGYAYEDLKCFTRVIGGNEYVINEWTDHRLTLR